MRVRVPPLPPRAEQEQHGVADKAPIPIALSEATVAGSRARERGATESFCYNRKLSKHIVPAGYGHAFLVKKGTRFRIVDLHGEQVVDLMAWVIDSSSSASSATRPSLEVMSPAYTRYTLHGTPLTLGESLYSSLARPLLRLTADTVKVHDMTYMACSPAFYAALNLPGHRSCAQNILDAMHPFGLRSVLEIPEPFNCFQNTPNYSLKAMGSSKPGDFVEFEGLVDEGLVVAVSCCPYDVGGFNGGLITDVAVVVSEEKE